MGFQILFSHIWWYNIELLILYSLLIWRVKSSNQTTYLLSVFIIYVSIWVDSSLEKKKKKKEVCTQVWCKPAKIQFDVPLSGLLLSLSWYCYMFYCLNRIHIQSSCFHVTHNVTSLTLWFGTFDMGPVSCHPNDTAQILSKNQKPDCQLRRDQSASGSIKDGGCRILAFLQSSSLEDSLNS
jgi:hypothetical protein